MIFTPLQIAEHDLATLRDEKDAWVRLATSRQERVHEAKRFVAAKAKAIAETERRIADLKREADRYEFYQRTDWRAWYRYDRKLNGFILSGSPGTTQSTREREPDVMCDASRIARMLRDDPYAVTFLDPDIRDFAAWVVRVQESRWTDGVAPE